MDDLAIVIPSLNESTWLERCLPTVRAAAGGASLDVIVVDIESTDGTPEVAAAHGARVVRTRNGGFAHASNAGALTSDARYVLFLNADTEVVSGTFGDLLASLDARPTVGIAGCRQLTADGAIYPTMRHFLAPGRVLAEALASERLAPSLGHRLLDMDLYDRDMSCDWVIGSFMLCRREALASAGFMDERFFFTSEEEDLCRRVRSAGWDVRHVPQMTIVHHVGKRGVQPRFEAQRAFSRRQYARKHFGSSRRAGALAAEVVYDGLRALPLPGTDARRRTAARAALRISLGQAPPPFAEPPPTALGVGASFSVDARSGEKTVR